MKAFAPLSRTLPFWPGDLFGPPGGMLDLVGITDFDIDSSATSLAFSGQVAWLQEIVLEVPAIGGASFALLDAGGFTEVGFNVALAPEFSLTFGELSAEFRFVSDALRPVQFDTTTGLWEPLLDADLNPAPAVFGIGAVHLQVDGDGQVAFVDAQGQPAAPAITAPAMALANSGIVLELTAVRLFLSDKQTPPAGAPAGFKGIAIDEATIHLGDAFGSAAAPDTVTITNLLIGASGFSGTIAASWTYQLDPDGNYTGAGMGELLGMKFGLKSLEFVFSQNRLVGSAIKGVITLPFFDHPLGVTVGYDANGGLTVGIDAPDGLFTLTKPGFLEVEVASLRIEATGKKAIVRISGKMTPLYGGLDWPTFELRDLSIDSDGHVRLAGGWIDLPQQQAFDFNGFTLEITRFGLGKIDGGGRWVGFSAKVNLIKGIKGNASVDGLRITLRDNGLPSISLDGVGVDMKLAGAFELKGAVKFKDDDDGQRFDGAAMLSLDKPQLVFDTELTIGRRNAIGLAPAFRYFGMYGGLELPTGIPLGPSGVAIFGFAGLLALQMRPDRHIAEPWYALPPGDSWYHRSSPGVRPLMDKWGPKADAKSLGAGLTLGTYADNGFTFNAKALLVLAFPGPLLMIEGRGNLLKDRKALGGDEEPLFRALAVFDEEAGEYTFGLDAFYRYGSGGEVIDIRGSLEAYYNKHDPRLWHVWLGKKDPTSSRIQAQIITLFRATSYFMIDATGVQTGAWIGYDRSWSPSPLSITLQAWLDANARLSVKPNHFHADLWLHAAIELSAFGVGAGLSADALLAADIKDPFHIKGEMSVTLELPWPLKSITKDITLEWGPQPTAPPVPVVLHGAAIEHPKSSTVWPLAVGKALVPSYDDGAGYLGPAGPAAPSEISVVAMDARPAIAFGRAVHDDALVGVNALPPVPAVEQIGDPTQGVGPATVRFALKGIVLEKHGPSGWISVAGKGTGADGLAPLYGAWGTVPSGSDPAAIDQTKLFLWAKTPFVQTRHTGDDWNDWFANAYSNYPCIGPPPLTCYGFEGYLPGGMSDPTGAPIGQIAHTDNPGLGFSSHAWTIAALNPPVHGHGRALRPVPLPGRPFQFQIVFSAPAAPVSTVHMTFETVAQRVVKVIEQAPDGVTTTHQLTIHSDVLDVTSTGSIASITVTSELVMGIVEVCLDAGGDAAAAEQRALAANLRSATSVWADQGNVLEPYTDYRLAIVTEAAVTGSGAGIRSQTSHAYFTTGGPPGLGGFSVAAGQTAESVAAGPDSLAAYVRQTVPATVTQDKTAPAMPRPVFRAYDVGVEFNADYVDLLYRLAHRDLTLQILDSNGALARDAVDRSLSFPNPWGVTGGLVLDDASAAWLAAVDPECLPINHGTIAHNQTFGTTGVPLLLEPATRYRARLVPLVVHDDFAAPGHAHGAHAEGDGARIGDWLVAELDDVVQASRWTVDNAGSADGIFVVQDRALPGSATAATECPPGSALLWAPAGGGPLFWRSQRVSLFLSGAAGGAAGVVLLYAGPQDYFAVTLHEADGVCRLVHRTGGSAVKLAEGPVAFTPGTDVELVVEVCDTAIRVFVDDAATLAHYLDLSQVAGGETGLWCWNNPAARFKDVRIEDQSGLAATAFSFEFVSSGYVNFFHLAHTRRTPVWQIETEGGARQRSVAELAQLTSAAVATSTAPLEAGEIRQYEDLVALWLGPGLVRDPVELDVNCILRQGAPLGWLIRSAEPLTWERAEITLLRSTSAIPANHMLGPVKIVGAALGMTAGDDEYVELIGLEDRDLKGWRLQMRQGSGAPPSLVEAPFDDPASTWLDLHVFAAADRIEAGLRLRVYSGGLVQPPSDHTQRTMNMVPAGDPGTARLPAIGADLRLVDPTGRAACATRILPESAFVPVTGPVRLLRKGDATGMIVLPNGGDAISAGTYALSMRYRRDITSIDPGSIVLSQAGETTDELAIAPLY